MPAYLIVLYYFLLLIFCWVLGSTMWSLKESKVSKYIVVFLIGMAYLCNLIEDAILFGWTTRLGELASWIAYICSTAKWGLYLGVLLWITWGFVAGLRRRNIHLRGLKICGRWATFVVAGLCFAGYALLSCNVDRLGMTVLRGEPTGLIRWSGAQNAIGIMGKYESRVREELAIQNDLGRIGHRAGDLTRYAKNLNRQKRPDDLESIVELMHQSFEELELDGIEIDAHLVSLKDQAWSQVSIFHDPLEGTEDQRPSWVNTYLQENTLERVVQNFADKKYYSKAPGKTIFVELKTKHTYFYEGNEDSFDQLNRAIVEIIDRTLQQYEAAALIRNHLAFVSFNYEALAHLHKEAEARNPSHNYRFYWIATSNRCVCLIRKWTPVVTPMVLGSAEKDAWLTGIWFDPAFFIGWGRILSYIDQQRENKGLPLLELSMSTYYQSEDQFFRRAKWETEISKPRSIRGLIFDLQRN